MKKVVSILMVITMMAGLYVSEVNVDAAMVNLPDWPITPGNLTNANSFNWIDLPYEVISGNKRDEKHNGHNVYEVDEGDDLTATFSDSNREKVQNFIKRGYTINYRIAYDIKDIDQAYSEVGLWGGVESSKFGNGNDGDPIYPYWITRYFGREGDSAIPEDKSLTRVYFTADEVFNYNFTYFDPSYDTYRQTLPNNNLERYGIYEDKTVWFQGNTPELFGNNKLTFSIERSGGGDDKCYISNVRMQVAIMDTRPEIPVYITDMYYADNVEESNTPLSPSGDGPHLSYNGDNHSVDMVVVFDKPVRAVNTNMAENYILTNLSVGDTMEGSFNLYPTDAVPDNVLVFRYETNYGGWGREGARQGLGNETHLEIPNEATIMNALVDNIGIRGKNGTSDSDLIKNDVRGNVVNLPNDLNIRVDGDPPEIAEVTYDVLDSDTEPFLNVGDTVEINVRMADMPADERVYVDDNGYFEFNTGAKAAVYNNSSTGYGSGDWITYRYTIAKDDVNTNNLNHLIQAQPPSDAYANQVFDMAKKMGIRDDFDNVAMMLKAGKDRFNTLLFPAVKGPDRGNGDTQLYVDTIAPKVLFDNGDFSTYARSYMFDMVPYETGSMLEGGQFVYVISKEENHPTQGPLDEQLGNTIYPYTRVGSDPDSGYSVIDDLRTLLFNNNLLKGKEGYTQYDATYNPITKETYYEDAVYVDGSASDVLTEGRREITGTFYIHTYMKDRAGNATWQTSQPIYLDNTPAKIRLEPMGTSKYVSDVNIAFELLDGGISGFDRYEYRWMDETDLDVNVLDAIDRYTPGTYTYNQLTNQSDDWIQGNSLDQYNRSHIPIPAFESRLHGASYLLIRAYDKADNPEYIVSEPYYFDKKAPTVTFESLSGGFDQALTDHEVKVLAKDDDTGIASIRYYLSDSMKVREIEDPIWKTLSLEFPPLPADYDYESGSNVDPLIKEATINTADWTEETLNGYTFLHIYTVDHAGNEAFLYQDMLIDNGGLPSIGFDYDGAIGNRYDAIIGHIRVADDSGAVKVEYAFTDDTATPTTYEELDMSQVTDRTTFTIDTPEFNQDGTWYLHVRITDTMNNVTTAVSEAYTVDSATPEAGIFTLDVTKTIVTNQEEVAVTLTKGAQDNIEYTYEVYTDEAMETLQSQGSFSSLSQLIRLGLDTNLGSDNVQTFYIRLYNDLMIPLTDTFEVSVVYDATPPTGTFVYSPEESLGVTDQSVTATLTDISDDVSSLEELIISDEELTFDKNGEQVITIQDEAGNIGRITATVSWITEDRLYATLISNQMKRTPYQALSFGIKGYVPSEEGAREILEEDQVTLEYQIGTSTEAIEDQWIPYTYGALFDIDQAYDDGNYYIITRMRQNNSTFEDVFGPYQLDNTAPQAGLTYSFTYTNQLDESVVFEGNQEDYDNLVNDMSAIKEVTSDVTVTLGQFNEDNTVLQGVYRLSEGEEPLALPITSSYVLSVNDHLEFVFRDQAGNEGRVESMITILTDGEHELPIEDVTDPIGVIQVTDMDGYSKRIDISITDESPVTMTGVQFVDENDGDTEFTPNQSQSIDGITYNGTTHSILTTKNGTVTYTFEDSVGHIGTASEVITGINLGIHVDLVQVSYRIVGQETLYNSLEALGVVNKSVEVILTLPEGQGYSVLNNKGDLNRVFDTGMAYDFLISNGHELDTLSVDLSQVIKKSGPEIGLAYTINEQPFRDQLVDGKTSQNVLLTVTGQEALSQVTFDGQSYGGAPFTYTFSENSVVTVVATDAFGNQSQVFAFVDVIDKEPTRAGLFSLYTQPTKEEAITLEFISTKAVVVNNVIKDGSDYSTMVIGEVPNTEYRFTVRDNGRYGVQYTDDLGNMNTVYLDVTNFDREAPKVKLLYNGSEIKTPTKENVMVSVALIDENQEPDGIEVLNTVVHASQMLFKENGRFTFIVSDTAGNTTEIEAVVDQIDRSAPEYTVDYSTTSYTKNPVVATVTIGAQDPDYKVLNSDIDQQDGNNSYNTNVKVTGQVIAVTFEDNGFYPLEISDAAGNRETIVLRVKNIDRIAPEITFERPYVVTGLNENVVLTDYAAFDDHDGNITEQVMISQPDTSQEGMSTVTYTVTDTAGNTTTVNREIKVLGDAFSVVANGQERIDAFRVDGSKLEITVYNYIENLEVRYLEADKKGSGTVKDSVFKTGGVVYTTAIDEDGTGKLSLDFSASKSGWYTIYIQDTNRNTDTLTVFFTEAGREE